MAWSAVVWGASSFSDFWNLPVCHRYSCTEGETWDDYTFSETSIQVDGVLNEPGISTRIVRCGSHWPWQLLLCRVQDESNICSLFLFWSIYGHLNKDSAWMIIKVNFSSILTERCDKERDFYKWEVLDKVGWRLDFLQKWVVNFMKKGICPASANLDHQIWLSALSKFVNFLFCLRSKGQTASWVSG